MKGRGESVSEVLGYLRGLPLFSDLNDSSACTLAAACRFRHVTRGEIIFLHSDQAESAFVVRSGVISIVLNSPDGREMSIDEVHPGEMFGELELITWRTRAACAVAHSSGELLIIPAEAFLRSLEQEPCFVRRVLDFTAHRLHESTRRQMDLAFMNAQSRLARNLLILDEEQAEVGFVTVSQEELARAAGLIRQTVAKALGVWRRNGWLLTGRGRIVVLNRKALERVEMGLPG